MPVPRRRWLGVIAAVAVVWFLQASRAVTLPLTFALFLTVLFWPVQRRVEGVAPRPVAIAVSFGAALAILATFVGALTYVAGEVAGGIEPYREAWSGLRSQVEAAVPGGVASLEVAVTGLPRAVAGAAWSVAGYLVVVLALFVLALSEVPDWRLKLRERTDTPVSDETLEAVRRVASKVQKFLAVQALTSVITGALTVAVCWILGVDFVLLWGLVALVLNFVPTLGSVVAVFPPTVFAALQFGVGWRAAAVLGALGLVQLVLGSYVDPKLQGQYLNLSPFVVLVAIVFWGWLWGIGGAFVAVPLTAAIVVACGETDAAGWVADLLTRSDAERSS